MVVITRPLAVKKPLLSNQLFGFQTFYKKNQVVILMRLFTKEVHTGKLSQTLPLLEEQLPSILSSTCFNEGNKPFSEEVLRTEIGHLFEHILLEYLCQNKLSLGFDEATFSGMTDWNWNKDPKGTFWITIGLNKKDLPLLPDAMERAENLLNQILLTHQLKQTVYYKESLTMPLVETLI